MALTPIDQVVRTLCRATGEPNYKNYDTILTHVRGAIIDLGLYAMPNIKTVYVKVNQLRNIIWPKDCVRPIQIDLERNGKTCPISICDDINPIPDCGCSCESDIDDKLNNFFCDNSNYNKGYDSANACVHDKETRSTHLKYKPKSGDKFIFIYNSDGITEGVDFIPVEAEQAIEEYVFWKYYRRTNLGLSDRGREQYKEEHTRLRGFYSERSPEEWVYALLKD